MKKELIDAVIKLNADLTTFERDGVKNHYSFLSNKFMVSEESLIEFIKMHDLHILSSPKENPIFYSYEIEGYCEQIDDKICFSTRCIVDVCFGNWVEIVDDADPRIDCFSKNISHEGFDTDTHLTAFIAVKLTDQYNCYDISAKKIIPTWMVYLRGWFDKFDRCIY